MNNERQPLYVQVQEHLKQLIAERKLKPNEKIPTEKELMEQFNVSRITVANALAEMAKEGRIYRIPGRGSFVSEAQPNNETTSDLEKHEETRTSTRSANLIGLVIPTLEDFFAIKIIQGIRKALEKQNYHLAIVITDNSKEKEEEVILQLIEKGAKGLIIFPVDAETYNEEILALKMNKFPFVLIDRYLPGVETHVVSSDSYLGSELAVNHLWNLGHRNIAICSDSPLPTMSVSDRISGYMEALRKREALINPSLILTEFNIDYSKIDEKDPLYRYLKNNIATAIITLNARLGLYIKSLALKMNLKVPDDLSIVTFDDPIPFYDDIGGFTHVNQFETEMGRKSVEILLKVIENPEFYQNHYEKVMIKPELVVKNSTVAL
ncbi:GntR family transcriptional regulator of arabinose operon [Pullulanibacillus pueri]|uniref:LacI family transcriptional regulator n=1 Tax=Pullulanibacillus pueri TaxID=1437324 RepID=A0A8J2ZTY7_9BACL|nr:GntR family transcriptional regulator [Pullulanibacillus pueri]MBM7681142.1 GntR family transcriptional regulator of arabinose operon [Pullulanibacillus pueri]GGH77209.1 LacI family transcriptional regulator [Pullulanibacillus pueri]